MNLNTNALYVARQKRHGGENPSGAQGVGEAHCASAVRLLLIGTKLWVQPGQTSQKEKSAARTQLEINVLA